jgi:hypothetical protein
MAINCVGGLPSNIEGYQIQGAQGIQGIQGAQGTQGLQGLKGPTGLPAPSSTYTPIGSAPTRTANGNVAFDPVSGGSYSWSDIEVDYSAHIDEVINQLHRLNDTHWSIKELMEVLVTQVTQIRTDQDIMAQQQTLMAIHQANMDVSLASIRDNHDLIRIVQEHMRKLADTTGITTRSPYDYLYTYSAVRGLEIDGISVGQAINTFNGLPAQTLASPPPSQTPPPASQLMWKGIWDETKTYMKDDIVFHSGKAYTAVRKNVGSPPDDNKIWKSVVDMDVIKSEEPKEVWKGTWNKVTNYPAGSIVIFKDGLDEEHVNSLNDLLNSTAASTIYKAYDNIPAFITSNIKPTDPPDAAGHRCWLPVDYEEEAFDECATSEVKGIQIVSMSGDFTCPDNSLGKLQIDAPVVVRKICYKIDDFVQMYKGTYSTSVYKARAEEIIPLYTGNNEYTTSGGDTRYAIARNPDHAGLGYWTTLSLQQGWSASSTELVTAFFSSLDSIPNYTRHLTAEKSFDTTGNGCGFYADPDNWSAGNSQTFNWTSRTVPNTVGVGHPAWGPKMFEYAIWDAPNVYNPIWRPISGNDGVHNIGINKTIKISILGGPPNTVVQIAKSANVNNFFGTGYVAGTVLSGTITLDSEGKFEDATQFYPIIGVASYTATFDSTKTVLNGYTRTYTVNVFESYQEPQIPSDPKNSSYDLVKQLNVGYEFSRETVINFPFDATYIFQGWVDNWGKVTLDGETVLDFNNNFLVTSEPALKAVPVKKGNHVIKLFAINYGPQTEGNPGGIGLSISSGGIGKIIDHPSIKTYKIKTTNGTSNFRLVNLNGSDISTIPGSADGYIFNLEKVEPNANTTEVEFKGCWEDCTIYEVHQMVLHNEKTWVATKTNTGNEPNENSRYWRTITTEEAAFIDDPPTWKGAWNDETTYVKHSIVSFKDESWICNKLVSSVPTPPPPDETPNDWKIVDDDGIRCQMPFQEYVEPPVTPVEEDTTLTYKGTYSADEIYQPFDVVDTITDDLIFFDPPRIPRYEDIESILIDEEMPTVPSYDELIPYEIGDIVLFDPEDSTPLSYYIAGRPILPNIANSPSNNPTAWIRLIPELLPVGETYDPNDVVPRDDKLYMATIPTTDPPPGTGEPPVLGWVEILPTGIKNPEPYTDPNNPDPNNLSPLWKDISEYTAGPAVNFVGPWDWRTYYSANDVVLFCNILYKAVAPSIGAVPPYNITEIADTTYSEVKWIKLEIVIGT